MLFEKKINFHRIISNLWRLGRESKILGKGNSACPISAMAMNYSRGTLSNCNMPTRDGNTKHENLVFRVSCISIQTRKPQVETRNKHEKSRNTKQTRKIGKFTCTPGSFKYYPFPLAFSPLAD